MKPQDESLVNVHPIEQTISAAAGAFLALRALRSRSFANLLLGGELLRRGLTGRCYLYSMLGVTTRPPQFPPTSVRHGVHGRASITIQRPREVVYHFWRRIENLPQILEHVVSVDARSYPRLRWKVRGIGPGEIEWDAEVHNEIPGELIAWRSLPGADMASAGSVHFENAPGGGTIVWVHLQYMPPAGFVGDAVAKLFGLDPATEIQSGLARLKALLEAREIPANPTDEHIPEEIHTR